MAARSNRLGLLHVLSKARARLTSYGTGPGRGVAPRIALWGDSVASFAKLEPGCPARCTRR